MREFKVEFPFPPSVNAMYENNRPGSRKPRRKSNVYNNWLFHCSVALKRDNIPIYAKENAKKNRKVWAYKAQLHVPKAMFYRLDLDNHFKAPIDLISKWMNIDDRYLLRESREKLIDRQVPGMLIMNVRVYENIHEYDRKTQFE